MDKERRRELQDLYKKMKTYMGVTKITNKKTGKIYIAAYPNLKNKWLSIQGQLDSGMHTNAKLQREWKELGMEAFEYEVLEEKATDDLTDIPWELKQMEKAWLEQLQPYGEKGYNKPPK